MQIERTMDDKTFATRETFSGTAILEKAGRLKIDMAKKGHPEVRETYVIAGEVLYWFDHADSAIRIYRLPTEVWPKAGRH